MALRPFSINAKHAQFKARFADATANVYLTEDGLFGEGVDESFGSLKRGEPEAFDAHLAQLRIDCIIASNEGDLANLLYVLVHQMKPMFRCEC